MDHRSTSTTHVDGELICALENCPFFCGRELPCMRQTISNLSVSGIECSCPNLAFTFTEEPTPSVQETLEFASEEVIVVATINEHMLVAYLFEARTGKEVLGLFKLSGEPLGAWYDVS